jgi:hypothetical protein
MALLVKQGFGQLEPNHLSAQRNGQIYAQLPCDTSIEVLQNAQFVKYDYANGKVNYTGEGEWMLVYNEVKLYDPRHSYKDFALQKKNCVDGEMVPRVMKTMVGDIFTTNLVDNGSKGSALAVKDKLTVAEGTGILTYDASPEATEMVWQVVKVYTMADGQPAVKIQRIA